MMPPRRASLPMYFPQDPRVRAFWAVLAGLLEQAGINEVPARLSEPEDLHAHWLEPDLLLSQTCGYPLVTQLKDRVQVLGTFAYGVPGCEGIICRSQIVVRQADAKAPLQRFAGATVAYNSTDSQSGYNSLRALVAPHANKGRFFENRVETGAHRLSIDCVRQGQADIAAIDCVTLAGIARDHPEKMQGLCVWGQTDAYPGLPLITSASTPPQQVESLRQALCAICQNPAYRALTAPLFIQGFQAMRLQDYQPCSNMHADALNWGLSAL